MRLFVFISIAILLASCDKPQCTNHNPIFDKYKPADKEYRIELAGLVEVADKDSVLFWINRYDSVVSHEYMYADVIGRNLCAIAIFDITGNEEFENFRRVKGVSYSGAGLLAPRYRIQHTDSGAQFVLDSVGMIVD